MQELRVESSVDLLVDRAREDRNAFGDLVRLHQHEVFTLAVRLVADRTVAADVAQDAFIRAWRALPNFRGDAAFPTWLHRITVNAAWSQRRRAAARPVSQLDEALAVPDTDPLGQPERVGEVADLRRAWVRRSVLAHRDASGGRAQGRLRVESTTWPGPSGSRRPQPR